MKKSHDIIGLSVVSIQEGKELGVIKQLVIDAAAGAVAGLLVDNGKWHLGAKALPFAAITGLGEYAVTINSENDIVPASIFDNLLSQGINVVGSLALTRNGNIIGNITEIIIDFDGKIVECLIENEDGSQVLTTDRVITYGKDVLIVANEGEQQIIREHKDKTVLTLPTEKEVKKSAIESSDSQQQTTAVDESDNLAKLFEEMQRKYLLSKKTNASDTDDADDSKNKPAKQPVESIATTKTNLANYYRKNNNYRAHS